jgi:hypothetical protein
MMTDRAIRYYRWDDLDNWFASDASDMDINDADSEACLWGAGRGLHSSTSQHNLSRFGHILVSPCLIDWGKTMHQTYPRNCAYVEPENERV